MPRATQHELQLAWDSINYQWDLRVLNFDEDSQRSFLFALGLGQRDLNQLFRFGKGLRGNFRPGRRSRGEGRRLARGRFVRGGGLRRFLLAGGCRDRQKTQRAFSQKLPA